MIDEGLRLCDFCLRSDIEVDGIRKTYDDEGLQVCPDCELIYREGGDKNDAGALYDYLMRCE